MAYSELPHEDLILLAAEFIGRGYTIPQEIRATLGPALMADIENPEMNSDQHKELISPRHRRGRT